MDFQTVGLIGGIAGGVVGLLGGIAGTYVGVSNARGPRERGFIARMAVLTWALTLGMLAWLLYAPPPHNYLAWVPYALALPVTLRAMGRRQAALRRADDEELEWSH